MDVSWSWKILQVNVGKFPGEKQVAVPNKSRNLFLAPSPVEVDDDITETSSLDFGSHYILDMSGASL